MLSIRIYLDDDSINPLLATLLRRAGSDPITPATLGLSGENDAVHLTRAIEDQRILLSGNHDDFEELHGLIKVAEGHHPGIFIVRRDNDRKRDMQPPGIVQAIERLCASGVPLADTFHVLNHWR